MVSESCWAAPSGGPGGGVTGAALSGAAAGAGTGEKRRGIGIETKFIVADTDHVGPRQPMGLPHALAIDVRAVDAEVDQNVPVRLVADLGMLARHFAARHHNIRSRVPSQGERLHSHLYSRPSVRHTSRPPVRVPIPL